MESVILGGFDFRGVDFEAGLILGAGVIFAAFGNRYMRVYADICAYARMFFGAVGEWVGTGARQRITMNKNKLREYDNP